MESTEDIPRKSKRASPNLVISKELVKSKAWLNLGKKCSVTPQVYLIFLSKRKMEKIGKKGHERWQCTNGQEIVFTFEEAKEKYEITQPRFTRAIDELIERGFVNIVTPANSLIKQPTLYGLSERWRKYGTSDFEKVSRAKRNLTIGFCKPKKKQQTQQEPN